MENNTIKIAYILSNNDKYSTIISLQSLLENNVEEYLDILFIADSTIEKEHIEYCQKMTKKYKNVVKCKIGFIDKQKYKYYINNPKFEFINRLYLFEIPYLTDAEKILFICPQTIVNKSLRELYDTDLTKNSCAGVEYVDNKLIQDTYNFENQKIFSNNILLINSKLWKEKKYLEKILSEDFIKNHINENKLTVWVFLNAIIDDCKYIPYKFDYTEELLKYYRK